MIRLIIIICLCIFATLGTSLKAQPQAYLDSLEQLASREKDPYEKAKLLNSLAYSCVYSAPQKGLVYAKEALKTLPKDSLLAKGYIYSLLSSLYGDLDSSDRALSCLDSTFSIFTILHHDAGLSDVYTNKAGVYTLRNEYDLAAEYIYKSLELNEQIKDTMGLAANYSMLISIALVQEDFDKALSHAYKALALHQHLKDWNTIGDASFNLSLVYEKKQQPDSIFHYSEAALEAYQKASNYKSSAVVYSQLGRYYRKQEQLEIASIYIEKAIGLSAYLSPRELLELQNNLSALYFQLKKYPKSLALSKQVLTEAEQLGSKNIIKTALELISQNYSLLGDYKNAYLYQGELFLLQDSILNETKQEQIKDLEIKYETNKKEQENKLLTQSNQLLEKERDIEILKANRNRQFTYSALIGLFLTILIAYLIIRQNKTQTSQKTTQIKHQLLRNQMNPHFIFNSLNAIQSFVYTNEPRAAGKYLSSFAKLVRAILENSRDEYITLDKEIQWLENYLKLQLLRFENKFDYQIDIADEIDIESTLIPPMLTQPFIENALEHGLNQIDYQGQLNIEFYLTNNLLEVKVQDNGIGINAPSPKKKDHVSLATVITKERLDFLNKKSSKQINFSIEPVVPKGTVVTFSIPLNQNF